VGQVGEADAGLTHPLVQVAHDLKVALLHRLVERGLVMERGDAVAADRHAVVRDVDALRVEPGTARAELGEHPAPVRVLAV